MATTVARLQAVLSANTRDFDRAMTRSETRMKKVGAAAKVGLAIGVGAGIAVLKSSVNAAIEAEKSQKRLETAFRAAGVSIDKHRGQIEKASTAAINLGFDDESLKDSLGSLIIATGDYNKAQNAANIAMDLARFKGIDLEQATKMLTMAMAGSQRATKQLGLDIPKVTATYDEMKEKFKDVHSEGGKLITQTEKLALENAKMIDKQKTAGNVIEVVSRKVKGQADAYKTTAEGSMAVFSAKLEELQEKLGNKLLPKLTQIVVALSSFIDKLERVDKWMSKVGANQSLIDISVDIDKAMGKLHLSNEDIINDFKAMWHWILRVVDALKDLKSWFDKIPGATKGLKDYIGDGPGPNFVPPGIGQGAGSISPSLYDELAGARRMGLTLTSGYRPGAVTKHGTPSDHGVYPSKAIDVAGPPSKMANFFRWLVGQSDVKQAFYDPLGSIFGGVLSSYREGGHSDHVHVATYDKGGWLKPGWNLAYNGLGVPEPVGAPSVNNFYFPNYVGSKSELLSFMQNAARKWRHQNGRGAF